MCHQSVGLLQGAIESAGISTISLSVRPEVTANMRVARAAYVRFPTGNPVGEAHKPDQQRAILRGVLDALEAIQEPGTLLEMPYRWKRMQNLDEARAPERLAAAPTAPGDGPLFAIAEKHTHGIQDAYTLLLERLEAYRAWLQAETAAEQAKASPDNSKLQALSPQLKYLAELFEALEGPAHDGLVRVSDRTIRIRHWEDGVFI